MITLVSLARKNSKRIPGKNYKNFCGKPLIDYTLNIMYKLKMNSCVMTDYQDIKDWIIEKYYLEKRYEEINIINMPEKYAQDKHDLMGSLKHIHKEMKSDIYVLLQPTSPIRDIRIIRKAIRDFQKSDKLTGFSAYQVPIKYYWSKSGYPVNFYQMLRDGNGTEKEALYVENGSFYIFRSEILDFAEHVILDQSCMLFIDKYNVDLDTIDDWKKAERHYNKRLI
jgi:CMP-N-acetylneuraminic acid synthetase